MVLLVVIIQWTTNINSICKELFLVNNKCDIEEHKISILFITDLCNFEGKKIYGVGPPSCEVASVS